LESKRKHLSYKDILYKSRRAASFALILIFGAGVAITSTWQTEIPVHDGDILVDSLAVSEETAAPADGTFDEMRAVLELERNKLIAALDSTINSSKNQAEIDNASKEKQRILDFMETELAVESLIHSKKLPDSYVVITESSVCVTVDKQELDTNTVAKICDIVMRETGRPADKIVVQSKY
jgi:hypothetical protein